MLHTSIEYLLTLHCARRTVRTQAYIIAGNMHKRSIA